ncbi:DUF4332 domain-containing protein [Synechococcus sp. MIT S9503]|uniref:DUF4332 domain-containing protein n=1 Tax=Synechococcus sp. MIT S9503 TaxID=3082547 RepID=UPI0039A7805C
MKPEDPLQDLPQSMRDEGKQLLTSGITTWGELQALDEMRISRLAASGRASARNLRRLKGMADLACSLDLAPQDAALLMHAGLATVTAIAGSTPQELVTRTGRLERQLRSGRPPVVDLALARRWILRARERQNTN